SLFLARWRPCLTPGHTQQVSSRRSGTERSSRADVLGAGDLLGHDRRAGAQYPARPAPDGWRTRVLGHTLRESWLVTGWTAPGRRLYHLRRAWRRAAGRHHRFRAAPGERRDRRGHGDWRRLRVFLSVEWGQ